MLLDKRINYFEIALDNTNTIKKFTINKYFEPSDFIIKICTQKDKLYNFSRKFLKIFQPFQKSKTTRQLRLRPILLIRFVN